jgi:hypothetical protein
MRAVTKYLLLLWLFIMLRGKGRTYFYERRKALVPVQRSPWKKLLQRDRDQKFMLYLGISRSAFEFLISAFNRVWPRKRTRIFSCQDVLALSLVWTKLEFSDKSMFALCSLWHKALSRIPWTWVGLACIDVVCQLSWARIKWWSDEFFSIIPKQGNFFNWCLGLRRQVGWKAVRSLQTGCVSLGEIPTLLVSLCNVCGQDLSVALCTHFLWVTWLLSADEKGVDVLG